LQSVFACLKKIVTFTINNNLFVKAEYGEGNLFLGC